MAYDAVLTEIRRAMSESQITQAQVGERLGIKQSAVSSLISGKSKITLEQFLQLAELVGDKAHKILSTADAATVQTIPMPYEIETALYKSEIHLLAYCAATQEISATDLATDQYPLSKVKSALDDLVKVGILTKKRDKYIQANPHTTYRASSVIRSNACHLKVVQNAWKLWQELRQKQGQQFKFFNFFLVDRFTTGQMKEIDSMLWKVYERIQILQRENMAAGYLNEDEMPLWNIHLMLMRPLGM